MSKTKPAHKSNAWIIDKAQPIFAWVFVLCLTFSFRAYCATEREQKRIEYKNTETFFIAKVNSSFNFRIAIVSNNKTNNKLTSK